VPRLRIGQVLVEDHSAVDAEQDKDLMVAAGVGLKPLNGS
jgi:hypothetical protein